MLAEGDIRFFGRGEGVQPASISPPAKAFGKFFVRLESGGAFDKKPIAISPLPEWKTAPQSSGIIGRVKVHSTFERDSYLFEGRPGEKVNIVVYGSGIGPLAEPLADPLVELYDPEGFLLAANDNAADGPDDCRPSERGKNPLLCITLPKRSVAGESLPDPSIYRIVVSAVEEVGEKLPYKLVLGTGTAYRRRTSGSDYNLKVFSGAIVTPSDDTDTDGMPNDFEIANGLGPTDPTDAKKDKDDDDLNNLEEYRQGTKVNIRDTDGDGFNDGFEVRNRWNPLVKDVPPDFAAILLNLLLSDD